MLAAQTRSSQVYGEPGTLAYIKTRLTEIVHWELDRGLPSVSLSLVKGNAIVWSAAFGVSNVALNTSATTETLYMTASTLKPITATAMLTLVDQGKCELDDPVNMYIDNELINDNVTIRSLLDHTSGLSDIGGQDQRYTTNVWNRRRLNVPILEDIVESLESVESVGKTWRYNNSAYTLVGLLIEKISGMPFEQYVVDHVMEPVGGTTKQPFNPTAEMAERMSFNYNRKLGGELEIAEQNFDGLYPAGDARMRAEDMARFLGAHINNGVFNGHRILSQELVDASHVVNMDQYGLGWWIFLDGNGNTMITHGGNWPSAVTAILGDKDAKVGAYVMTNVGQTQATYRIAESAVRLLRGETVKARNRSVMPLDLSVLRQFTGRYKQPNGVEITIEAGDGSLRYLYPLEPPYNGIVYTYFPISDSVFLEPDIGIELEFTIDETGNLLGFHMRQHGWLKYGYTKKLLD